MEIAEVAEDDIREAFLWYESQKKGLGNIFEIHFLKAVASIKNSPLKTQIRYGTTRVFFLDKFPYGIHFKIQDKVILIVGVFHTSLNPKKWNQRAK